MRVTRTVDTTQFGALAEHRNLQPASCSFLQDLEMRSDLQQAAPDRDCDCMGPIVCLKFIHQVLDVEVNRGLRNRQLIGNLLVAIAISNESKNLQLPGRKVVVTQMLGEASRHLGRNMPPASVNRSDHAQQFAFRHALKYVSRRSRSQCTLDVPIAVGGCQDDDTSSWKL